MSEDQAHPSAQLDGGVMTVTLHRPEKLNAMRSIDFNELLRLAVQFRDNDEARVLVLTGEGRAFCAGEDLQTSSILTQEKCEAVRDEVEVLQQITRTLYETAKPTIAAINGVAVGFGVEVSLACDIRIASEDAYFWLSEAERGLIHTNACFYLLPRIVGTGNARAMMIGGARVSATRALEIGLVSRVLAADDLSAAAQEMAAKIGSYSPDSIELTKRLLRNCDNWSLEATLDAEVVAAMELAGSGDTAARIASFNG